MRLLNVKTMKLEEFFGLNTPDYAILSHCWGEEEVTFQDINSEGWQTMLGAKKILYAASQAAKDFFNYVWIDTCCIDKSSSAELSEAINSMYTWYEDSNACYAYVESVHSLQSNPTTQDHSLCFEASRWFTRGWTLQELIAPANVDFFGKEWVFLGDKMDLSDTISSITRIPSNVLKDPSMRRSCSVAKKMSWASYRKTTRVEDVAYSLMGLFGVNMPLLYGEGDNAFIRLQEEILKESDDQSLFAWGLYGSFSGILKSRRLSSPGFSPGVLAQSPSDFGASGNVVPIRSSASREPYSMTNKGLRIELPILVRPTHLVAMLDCQLDMDYSGPLGMCLRRTNDSSVFSRHMDMGVGQYSTVEALNANTRLIYISKKSRNEVEALEIPLIVSWITIKSYGYQIVQVLPKEHRWDKKMNVLKMALERNTNSAVSQSKMKDRVSAALAFYNDKTDAGIVVSVALSVIPSENADCVVKIKRSMSISAKLGHQSRASWLAEIKVEGTSPSRRQALKMQRSQQYQTVGAKGFEQVIMCKISQEKLLNQDVFALNILAISSTELPPEGSEKRPLSMLPKESLD